MPEFWALGSGTCDGPLLCCGVDPLAHLQHVTLKANPPPPPLIYQTPLAGNEGDAQADAGNDPAEGGVK